MKKTKLVIILFFIFILNSCNSNENIEVKKNVNVDIEKNIIVLGDSLVAGYNLEIADSYPMQLEKLLLDNGYNYKIINAGVSGDTSKNLLDRISLYDDIKTDIYIITIGGNDGLRGQSLENMENNIEKIINYIKTINKDAKIVLTGMQIPINLGLNYSRDFKNLYPKIAKENDIFLYDFLLEKVAKDPNLNLNDGIHPNQKGYKIIAENIYDFLKNNNLITK